MPTRRLAERIRRDFAPTRAAQVIDVLDGLPVELYGRQDPERIQAALVLAATGDFLRLLELITLLRTDFRDVLVAGELANGDWPHRLDIALADQPERS